MKNGEKIIMERKWQKSGKYKKITETIKKFGSNRKKNGKKRQKMAKNGKKMAKKSKINREK